jgi:hypothetical protein
MILDARGYLPLSFLKEGRNFNHIQLRRWPFQIGPVVFPADRDSKSGLLQIRNYMLRFR